MARVTPWFLPAYIFTLLLSLLEGEYRTKPLLLGPLADKPGYAWIDDNPILGVHYFGDFVDTFVSQKLFDAGGYFGIYSIALRILEPLSIEAAFLSFIFLVASILYAAFKQIAPPVLKRRNPSNSDWSKFTPQTGLVLFSCISYPMLFGLDRGNASLLVGALYIFAITNLSREAESVQNRNYANPRRRSPGNSSIRVVSAPWMVSSFALGFAASVKPTFIICTSVFVLLVTRSWRAVVLHWIVFISSIMLQIVLLDNFYSVTYAFSGTGLTDLEAYGTLTNTFSSSPSNPFRLVLCAVSEQCGAVPINLALILAPVLSLILLHSLYLAVRRRVPEFSMITLTAGTALTLVITPFGAAYNNVIYVIPLLGYGLGLLGKQECRISMLLWLLSAAVLLPARFGIVQFDSDFTDLRFSIISSGITVGQYLFPIFAYAYSFVRMRQPYLTV